MPHLRRLGILCGVLSGTIAVAAAQGQRPAASLDDLLSEVRGLRADINQSAGASIRAQLLMGRLQLQEQRTNTVVSQLADVRRLLSEVERRRDSDTTQLKRIEEALQSPNTPQPQRKELEQDAGHFRSMLAQHQREEQRLRSQESELAGALAAEQGRWLDFNARLDELERAFSARR